MLKWPSRITSTRHCTICANRSCCKNKPQTTSVYKNFHSSLHSPYSFVKSKYKHNKNNNNIPNLPVRFFATSSKYPDSDTLFKTTFSKEFVQFLQDNITQTESSSSTLVQHENLTLLQVVDDIAHCQTKNKQALFDKLPWILIEHEIDPLLFEHWIFAIKSDSFERAFGNYLNKRIVLDNPVPLWVTEYLPFELESPYSAEILMRFLDEQLRACDEVDDFVWYRVAVKNATFEQQKHLWQMFLASKTLASVLAAQNFPYVRQIIDLACHFQDMHILHDYKDSHPSSAPASHAPSLSHVISQAYKMLLYPLASRSTAPHVQKETKRILFTRLCKYVLINHREYLTPSVFDRMYGNGDILTPPLCKLLATTMLQNGLKPTPKLLREMLLVESRVGNLDAVEKLWKMLSVSGPDPTWVGNVPEQVYRNNMYLQAYSDTYKNVSKFLSKFNRILGDDQNIHKNGGDSPTSISSLVVDSIDKTTTDFVTMRLYLRAMSSDPKVQDQELLDVFEQFYSHIVSKYQEYHHTNGNGNDYFNYLFNRSHDPPQEHILQNIYWRSPNLNSAITTATRLQSNGAGGQITTKKNIDHLISSLCEVTMRRFMRPNGFLIARDFWYKYAHQWGIKMDAKILNRFTSILDASRQLPMAIAIIDNLVRRKDEPQGVIRSLDSPLDPNLLMFKPIPEYDNDDRSRENGSRPNTISSKILKPETTSLETVFDTVYGPGKVKQMEAINFTVENLSNLGALCVKSSYYNSVWTLWEQAESLWKITPDSRILTLLLTCARNLYSVHIRSLKRNQAIMNFTTRMDWSVEDIAARYPNFSFMTDSFSFEYKGQKWNDSNPWDTAKQIFEQSLQENYTELVPHLHLSYPNEDATHTSTFQPDAANTHQQEQDETLELRPGYNTTYFKVVNRDDLQPQYPFIEPNLATFEAYIKLCKELRSIDGIFYAVDWVRALGLPLTQDFVDTVLNCVDGLPHQRESSKNNIRHVLKMCQL